MDNLKRRIHNNKEFEVYDFDPTTSWDVIAGKLDGSHVSRKYWHNTYWRLAAVFVVVLGLILIIFFNSTFLNSANQVVIANSEVQELELFYTSKIDEKLLLLTGKLNSEPIVQEDLDRLQKEYLELKIDLKDNADSEEVIAAMIMNYKVRLQLLERMIYEIHDNENESNANIHL
jgi:hypothetical protein